VEDGRPGRRKQRAVKTAGAARRNRTLDVHLGNRGNQGERSFLAVTVPNHLRSRWGGTCRVHRYAGGPSRRVLRTRTTSRRTSSTGRSRRGATSCAASTWVVQAVCGRQLSVGLDRVLRVAVETVGADEVAAFALRAGRAFGHRRVGRRWGRALVEKRSLLAGVVCPRLARTRRQLSAPPSDLRISARSDAGAPGTRLACAAVRGRRPDASLRARNARHRRPVDRRASRCAVGPAQRESSGRRPPVRSARRGGFVARSRGHRGPSRRVGARASERSRPRTPALSVARRWQHGPRSIGEGSSCS
jgi:hypothetical protein